MSGLWTQWHVVVSRQGGSQPALGASGTAARIVVEEIGAKNEQNDKRATMTIFRDGDSLSYTSSGTSTNEE